MRRRDLRCLGNDAPHPDEYFFINWARRQSSKSYFLAGIFVDSTESYTDL